MSSSDQTFLSRRLSWPIGLVLVAGIALSIAQQLVITDEVFASGDGGLKWLMTKQFSRGTWSSDLRLAADPWVQDLWDDGYYPFGQPFVYEKDGLRFLQYPLPFMVLTSPFYRWFGFRGLTLVPLLGLWLLWISFVALLGELQVSRSASVASLAGLIFSSFVTPYGAMYWEHTLALGLSFLGFVLLISAGAERSRLLRRFVAGGLLGAAVWFRPESVGFAVGVGLGVVVLGTSLRSWLSAIFGLALAGIAFVCLNFFLYDSLTGIHGIQQVDPAVTHFPRIPSLQILRSFVGTLVRLCPVVALVAAFVSVCWARVTSLRCDKPLVMLLVVGAVSAIGTSLIVPNSGGSQFGARYFLHVVPILFLLVALVWDRVAALGEKVELGVRVAVIVLLLFGVQMNTVQGTEAIVANYQLRILPALQAVREEATGVVVVEHQWMAQELASAFETRTFFLVRTLADYPALARRILSEGRNGFTLIRWSGMHEEILEFPGGRINFRPRGRFGSYVVVDASISSSPSSGI